MSEENEFVKDRRRTDQDLHELVKLIRANNERPRLFGLPIDAWVKIAAFACAVLTFYVRTDDTVKRLVAVSENLTQFARNSDTYHTSITGVPFQNGIPAPGQYANRQELLKDINRLMKHEDKGA